jgi:putative transcriptional regulator
MWATTTTMQNILYIMQYIYYNTFKRTPTKRRVAKMSSGPRVHNRIRVARVEKGYTQQELADLVGVTRQTIGLIEAEKYNPTIVLCLNMAKVLHKKLDELFWLEGGK